MSARLVTPTAELAALAEPARTTALRADEPYRRALQRHLRPADRHRRASPRTAARRPARPRAGRRTRHPAELRADLDVVDASLRSHGARVLADDRLARLREAVRRLRVPPVRAGPAAELRRCTRRSSRELLAWAGVLPRLRRARRGRSGSSCWPASSAPAGRWSRAGRRALGDWPASELDVLRAAAGAVALLGPHAVPNYVICMCQSVSRRARGRRPAQGGRACSTPSGERPYAARSASSPLFETIDDLQRGGVDPRRDARPAALPGAGGRPRRAARRSCSATPTATRTAATSPPTGRCTAPSWTWSTSARETGHPAAAVPRPRRHGRPRRRPQLRGDPGAAAGRGRRGRCGSPSRARSSPPSTPTRDLARRNLETLVAATLEATLLDVEGLGDDAEPAYELLDDLAGRAQRAYAELVHETPGFVDFFRAATPISEIGELNIGSRPPSRKPGDVDRRPAGHPVGVRWSQSRIMLPGWYGTGSAFEAWVATTGPDARSGWSGCTSCTGAGRSSARCCRTWRRCWPRPTWASPPATPSWSTTRRCGTRVFDQIAAEHERTFRMLADHRRGRPAGRQPGAGPLGPQPLPLPGAAAPPAGRAAAAPPRRRRRRAGPARHPADDQRHRDRAAQQRLGLGGKPPRPLSRSLKD